MLESYATIQANGRFGTHADPDPSCPCIAGPCCPCGRQVIVDTANAKARNPEDKALIDSFISTLPGGHAQVNQVMEREVTKNLQRTAATTWIMAGGFMCCPCYCCCPTEMSTLLCSLCGGKDDPTAVRRMRAEAARGNLATGDQAVKTAHEGLRCCLCIVNTIKLFA